MRRWLPLLVFVALVGLLAWGLGRDPTRVPSPLIGKPVPAFELGDLFAADRVHRPSDWLGEPYLLNVWASWCAACRVEHPFLMALAEQGAIRLIGLNYKDAPGDARAWLARHGNPYAAVAVDPEGRAALDLGVYGAPETFLVDPEGRIAFKQIGPLTERVWRDEIAPLLAQWRTRP